MDLFRTITVASAAFAFGASATLHQANPSPALDAAGLKSMFEGLGYEVKDLNKEAGKEKFEVPCKTTNFNVPVAAEISPSRNYIWLTVNLTENSPKTKHEQLLKESNNVQPTFFYITSKNRLMVAEAIDNRQVTPAILKRCLDKLVADVEKTSPTWKD